jgi:hypothetical protein
VSSSLTRWRAACAKHCLFMKTGIYGSALRSLLHIVTGATTNFPVEQAQSSFEKQGKGANLCSRKKRKRPFISNRIFKHIELTRWSAALRDGA